MEAMKHSPHTAFHSRVFHSLCGTADAAQYWDNNFNVYSSALFLLFYCSFFNTIVDCSHHVGAKVISLQSAIMKFVNAHFYGLYHGELVTKIFASKMPLLPPPPPISPIKWLYLWDHSFRSLCKKKKKSKQNKITTLP